MPRVLSNQFDIHEWNDPVEFEIDYDEPQHWHNSRRRVQEELKEWEERRRDRMRHRQSDR